MYPPDYDIHLCPVLAYYIGAFHSRSGLLKDALKMVMVIMMMVMVEKPYQRTRAHTAKSPSRVPHAQHKVLLFPAGKKSAFFACLLVCLLLEKARAAFAAAVAVAFAVAFAFRV